MVETLLEELSKMEHLFNTKTIDYHNRNMRQKAFPEISTILGVSAKDVGEKLRRLRTQVGAQLNLVKKSNKSGVGGGDI